MIEPIVTSSLQMYPPESCRSLLTSPPLFTPAHIPPYLFFLLLVVDLSYAMLRLPCYVCLFIYARIAAEKSVAVRVTSPHC